MLDATTTAPETPAPAATTEPEATPAVDADVQPTPAPTTTPAGDIDVVSVAQETEARAQALRDTRIGGATTEADPATGEFPPVLQHHETPSLEDRPDVHTVRGEVVTRTRIIRHKKTAAQPLAKKEVK